MAPLDGRQIIGHPPPRCYLYKIFMVFEKSHLPHTLVLQYLVHYIVLDSVKPEDGGQEVLIFMSQYAK